MSNGWVKFHRSLASSPLWLSEKFTRGQAWADLIMLANYTNGSIRRRGIRVNIRRGQVGWSEDGLAERWGWSRGKVRRFLKELEDDGRIMRQTEQVNIAVTSLITITNYDLYQGNGTESGTEDSTENNTEDSTEDGTGTRIGKTSKKEKKEKKTLPPISPQGGDVSTHSPDTSGKVNVSGVMMTPEQAKLFYEFWQAYPEERRTGKGAAVKAWMKIGVDALLSARMVQALEKLKLTDQWNEDGGKFIPLPTTWLNQRRWEDDIPEPPKRKYSNPVFWGGI